MADAKISALTNLTAADAINDMIPIVDVSDTPPASGNTKRISINNLLSSSPTASGALTVTGLVTAGSAAITGAATVGTTLGVTGNSTMTGSVGIGVAPAQKLTVLVADAAQAAQFRAASAYVRLRPYVDATNGGILDATNTGESAYTNLTILANSLRLFGNNASGITVGTTGDVTVGAGNVVMATSGKGIDFSATAGTGTSELLADYEEGTFTPTLQFSGLSVGVTYTNRTGIYTKVGRIVHFSGRIDLSSKGTSVGDATIAGLPFAANTGAASVGYQSSIAPSDKQAILTIDTLSLIVRYASGTTTAASTDTNFSNSSILIFAGTYAV
jgi:hypothetical protein